MCHALRVARLAGAFLCAVIATAGPARAQTGVGVEVKEVTDNRSRVGQFSGNLQLKMALKGSGLERINAARVLVKSAKDDKGNDLWTNADQADFQSREYNMGELSVTLRNPARAAKTIRVSGSVELFVPAKDPNSVVKIDKALSKLDTPLSAKALKAEKLSITILSPKKHEEKRGQTKLDDKKIAEIREQARKEGADPKEVEAMIELAKAFQELGGGSGSENSVVLSGKQADLDRILKVRLLKTDGSELSVPSSSSNSSGGETIMVLEPSEPPPADVALELTILTKKATMSVPFELTNIQLP